MSMEQNEASDLCGMGAYPRPHPEPGSHSFNYIRENKDMREVSGF